MAFWAARYWGADYWSADYWSEESGEILVHSQNVSVAIFISPDSPQTWEASYDVVGDVHFTTSFTAGQEVIQGTFEQTGDAAFVPSFTATQTRDLGDYTHTGDVDVTFTFSAAQYLGLNQLGDVVFTTSFTATQVVTVSGLDHEHSGDPVIDIGPYASQLWLEPFTGLEAIASTNSVDGYPDLTTTLVLSPFQNLSTETFFEFTVTSNDLQWLSNAGKAGNPVFINIQFGTLNTVSVNLYKSRFIIDYTMGSVYDVVRAGLQNKNLNVTLRGLEVFPTYVLANELVRSTTIRVRAYNERRV